MGEARDFFISRAGADKDAAIWIARTLTAAAGRRAREHALR